MKIIENIFSLLVVALLLAAVSASKNGKLWGTDNRDFFGKKTVSINNTLPEEILKKYGNQFEEIGNGIWTNHKGVNIVYSAPYTKDITGYAGVTPVYLIEKDKVVEEVFPAENAETKSFFGEVVNSGLLDRWNNMTLEEAAKSQPDAVSGATLSSAAIIKNVQASAQVLKGIEPQKTAVLKEVFTINSAKTVAALLVLASGLVISLFVRKKKWRTFQLVLNFFVLGFWCGQFISMSWLVGWLSSGANILFMVVPFVMLLLAIVLPWFDKKSYYCNWICPFGAGQELVSKIPTKKHGIPPYVMKYLKYSRQSILILIMSLAWLGVSFDLIGYEPFSAFIFNQADTAVIVIAVLFLVLSLFVHRPWCRFVCPTGQILDWCRAGKK